MLSIQKAEVNQEEILLDRNITDLMRFIACLMVAMSHYSGYVLVNDVSSNIIYKVIAANGGYLGVALFFFLSGYGLMKSELSNHLGGGKFFKRRLLKTYIPAVLVSAIWLVFAAMTSMDLLCNQHYFLGVVWNFNDEVLWFVNSILIMYVAFRTYVIISIRFQKCQWLVLFFIGLITYSFLRYYNIGSTLSVPLFFVGVSVAQFGDTIKRVIQNIWIDISVLFIAMTLLYLFRHDNYLLHGWIIYVLMGILLWTVSKWNITLKSVPQWLGGCSYNLYLVHYKVHLALLLFFGTDKFWMFVLGTAMATFAFYNLRKLLKI